MCRSALRLQVLLCLVVVILCLPRKPGYAGRQMNEEALARDPWQDSMAELRVYSKPMPPLVPNDEAGKDLPPKPQRHPDYNLRVPLGNVTKEMGPRAFTLGVDKIKEYEKAGYARRNMPKTRHAFSSGSDMVSAGNEFDQPPHDGDYDYDNQDDMDEDPNCPRDLYFEQMNMDFGETPRKYDWEQIGRHFVNYGRFTNDMSDDLMRGLDNRFKQMKG